ncbi:kinase non-catalytic C-lobe domain-containing protein 1 [Pelodytes ibericus]
MEEDGELQGYYEEEDEGQELYEFQPLPTLLEDEENVSLADILSLRDNSLTEQDIWAICLECCYSMKSISHSPIFQTLCITPDTLAFNTSGNVCFMEQLSDDPEGSFVPPEFDLTGNTLEAHIYSLGATLKAAIEFVIEPELETELCQDLSTMLDLMQQDSPADRPDIESIISLCEKKLSCSSSSMVCRSLSSIGRRVLSIESVTALQDGLENLWKGINKLDRGLKQQANEKDPKFILNISDSNASSQYPDICQNIIVSCEKEYQNGVRDPATAAHHSQFPHHVKKNKGERTQPGWSGNYENFGKEKLDDEMSRLSLKKHRRSKHQSPDRMPEKRSFSLSPPAAGMTTLKSWPSMPSCLSPNEDAEEEDRTADRDESRPRNAVRFSESKIGAHTLFPYTPMPSHRNCNSPVGPSEYHSQVSYENLYAALEEENQYSLNQRIDAKITLEKESVQCPSHCNGVRSSSGHESPNYEAASHEEEVCISRPEDSPDQYTAYEEGNEEQQWISLKDLLSRYGQPLKEAELWALCHECLDTLQTYIDFPGLLCLESVLIDNSGEVLFVSNPNEEPNDAFCVPPEFDPQGVGTEKGCIYCIAAILWSAAKLNFPSNHKLALPKKLKRFLLNMAKREADDRPGLPEALQICRNFLLPRGIHSKRVWADLHMLACQSGEKSGYREPSLSVEPTKNSQCSSGFLPVSSSSRLTAVKGPVPLKDELPKLPAAFTSPATYFKPIVLMQKAETHRNTRSPSCPKEFEDLGEQSLSVNDISVSDLEDHKDKSPQLPTREISSSVHSTGKCDSTFSDSSSDRKESASSEASSVSSNSSTLLSSPFVNNYLLKQDPKTGSLKLVLVQLSVPGHMQSVSLETEPRAQSIELPITPASGTVANNCADINHLINCEPLPGSTFPNYKDLQTKINDLKGELPLSNGALSSNCFPTHQVVNKGEIKSSHECVSQINSSNVDLPTPRPVCSPLQKVVHLIRNEFAFDGYLENGIEDLAMGEYIFSLEGLQYTTFCGAICEKFCDLYWDEQLLENLYQVVNGKNPASVRASPQQCLPSQMLKKVHRPSHNQRKHGRISLSQPKSLTGSEEKSNASNTLLAPDQERSSLSQRRPLTFTAGTEAQAVSDTSRRTSFDDGDMTDLTPETVEKDQQSLSCNVTRPCEEDGTYRALSHGNRYCLSPDFPEENEEMQEVKHQDSSLAMSISPTELYKCNPGWSSAFYGSQLFDSEVQKYVNILGGQKEEHSKSMEAKRLELEQQLMIETKNYRKTIKFYQTLLLKGKRNKGSEVKELLPKLKGHLEEMKTKVQFLELSKKLLQVSYAEQWGIEPKALPIIAKLTSHESLPRPDDGESFLLIYTQKGKTGQSSASKSLQAGTPLGLMWYLYSCNAVLDGFAQQFLYTFRYFCSQEDLLKFFMDQIHSTFPREEDPSPLDEKIYHRSLVLLQTWIEDCWHIDFSRNPDLLDKLEDLSSAQILPRDERGVYLLSLLQELSSRKHMISSPSFNCGDKKEDTKSLHSLCTKLSEDNVSRKSFNWKLSKGYGPNAFHPKDKQYTVVLALPRPCYPSFAEDSSLSYVRADESGAYSVYECSVQQISCQLTILQEEMFQKCHPVHFLNSRALGVKDKSANIPKAFGAENLPAEIFSLYAQNCAQEKYLLQLLLFADNVSSWVAGEIVTSATPKLQVSVLTKFLLVAKLCYEQRDFASAVQILGGLENLIVRQLPTWKNLPSKVCEILEELKAVEVFLKSDSLCLMKGDRFRTLPTIPSAYLLAMHIQQLETGGFTMANGAFKWNKLRNIAKVISQVHAFREIPYSFAPDPELQFYLRQRIGHFSQADISILAAANSANFHHTTSEKHSRKIQDTLKKMKATFQ